MAADLQEDLSNGHLRQRALEHAVRKVARGMQQGDRIRAGEVLERMEPANYGRSWDEWEVKEAIDDLGEDGLVNARATGQATFLEGITRQGRARLSPAGRSETAASIINDRSLTIAGDNLGNAATGDHVAQTSTVTVNSLASGALEFLLGHVDDLPDALQEDVRDKIKAAHAELQLTRPD